MDIQTVTQICETFQVGIPLGTPTPIAGGRLHRLWLVGTELGQFVIKRFNPSMMLDPENPVRIARAERIAHELVQHQIPARTARLIHDKPLFSVAGNIYMLFDYVKGESYLHEHITIEQALQIGGWLAKIHALKLTEVCPTSQVFEFEKRHWALLIECVHGLGFTAIDELRQFLPALLKVQARSIQALDELNQQLVVSHCDLDPHNVLWLDLEHPVIIDWESAGSINPLHEVVEAAITWSLIRHDQLDQARFDAVLAGYQQGGGLLQGDQAVAFHAAMNVWLGWLEYNLSRFCGEYGIEDNMQLLSEYEATNTFKTMQYLLSLPQFK